MNEVNEMLTQEEVELIRSIMREELKPIKDDIADIKEDIRDINDAIGIISEWAEKVADKERIPFASGN
jgi:hypothetical protein